MVRTARDEGKTNVGEEFLDVGEEFLDVDKEFPCGYLRKTRGFFVKTIGFFVLSPLQSLSACEEEVGGTGEDAT